MYFRKRQTPAWLVLIILTVSAVVCMLSMVLVADEMCHRNIETRMPMYPGADVIESQHNFIRVRGIGISSMTLSTSGDKETVREWMRQVNLSLLENNQMRGLASVRWQVEPQENGSLIYYYSECAQ